MFSGLLLLLLLCHWVLRCADMDKVFLRYDFLQMLIKYLEKESTH